MGQGDAEEELRSRYAGPCDGRDLWRLEEGQDGVHEVGMIGVD